MAKNTDKKKKKKFQNRGLTKRHRRCYHTQQSPLRSVHQHIPWKWKRARNSLQPPWQITIYSTITVVFSSEHKLHQTISTLYQPLQQREIQQIWWHWSPNSHRHRQIKCKASRMTHGKLHFPLQCSIQGIWTQLLKHNITMLPTHIYKHCVTPGKRNLHGFQNRKNLLIA